MAVRNAGSIQESISASKASRSPPRARSTRARRAPDGGPHRGTVMEPPDTDARSSRAADWREEACIVCSVRSPNPTLQPPRRLGPGLAGNRETGCPAVRYGPVRSTRSAREHRLHAKGCHGRASAGSPPRPVHRVGRPTRVGPAARTVLCAASSMSFPSTCPPISCARKPRARSSVRSTWTGGDRRGPTGAERECVAAGPANPGLSDHRQGRDDAGRPYFWR